jgi:hypothetical protein
MYVYPNSNYSNLMRTDSPVFLAVEKQFWLWLESTNPANEYEEMYFGDEAIYDKKQAIQGAIDEMINEADETGKPVLISSFDFDAIFA